MGPNPTLSAHMGAVRSPVTLRRREAQGQSKGSGARRRGPHNGRRNRTHGRMPERTNGPAPKAVRGGITPTGVRISLLPLQHYGA